ncbi:hypothetical protein ACLIKD_10225 [Azonexus sp. IMCC34842]|uniref:hypothetical protein n=1 Tax=Azonexus sp. IMCC34842 TaxID=3420950 RepID=UPI003D0BDA67
MIISPPFLPVRAANQAEQAWLDDAFGLPGILPSTNAPEGSFPLGNYLAWHNGLHIQGQANAEGHTVVRAIADGEIIFVSPPIRANANADDPLNYNPFGEGASWTDNGIVIVRHTTEIGANDNQPTEIVYYSVYMHLSQIGRITPAGQTAARVMQRGDRIWRKDEIGRAGQVYGHAGQVHLEVTLDEANLTRLIGRAPDWVDPANIPVPTADGRIDSAFGAIWFYLPASTPIQTQAVAPTNHLRVASQTRLNEAVWVKMHYEGGSCTFTTFNNQGQQRGNPRPESNGEYNLYNTANTRHNALPQADRNRSSPSGWYELLRFGRNLGRGPNVVDKDPLPANAAHWRQIAGPNGQVVWADLNAEGSYKFSDADFLPIQGWGFFNDDSSPADQRCDSNNLKSLIADPDPNAVGRMEMANLLRRLGNAEVMHKLRRAVCQFPSEWDQTTVTARYGFVRELEPFRNSPEGWTAFEAHLRAVSFANLPAEYTAATWRFHPRVFIEVMRTCGWLSLNEIGQMLPRKGVRECIKDWDIVRERLTDIVGYRGLNRVFRKYNLTTANRQTAFLAQVYIETGCMRLLSEGGSGNPNPALPMTQYYAAFYGRGLMQLTWAGTYADYGKFRGFSDHAGAYGDQRITATSTHDWAAPTAGPNHTLVRDQRRWAPRFDPGVIASNRYNASDSGAFFWVQKHFTGTSNINRLADQGLTTELVGRMSILVNGGGNGYNERLQYAAFIERFRGDGVDASPTGTITATRQSISHGHWGTTGNAFTLTINYTPQRP